MAIVLGIDYGDKKVGLAISSGSLATPLKVIKYSDVSELIEKIKNIVLQQKAEKLVLGVSEGKSAEKSREFGHKLSKELNLPVEFVDETLSTQAVQALAIEAGMKRKKRKTMEDAFAAAFILQSYLDSQ